MRGQELVFVVVDDPGDYVVPSEGVQIVGPPVHSMERRVGLIGHFSIGRIADHVVSQTFNMGPDASDFVQRKKAFDDFPRDIEPHGRKKVRKGKQRLKGLRS